jgi:hypothetical protein
MLRLRRPEVPDGFELRVEKARQAIADAVASGQRLGDEHFADLWSGYKKHLWRAQHGKCGYCESRVTDTGDVEHYRPKAAVSHLPEDEDLWGTEIDHGSNVTGRLPVWISPRGYHWLTYAWSNYLLACERCNRAWKGNLFPVAGAARPIPPELGAPEIPLLLNPFEGEDPTAHLAFDQLGQIRPRAGSLPGWETIRTCGLDRESLRAGRQEKAKRAHQAVLEYARSTGEAREKAKTDLLELGHESHDFAGMVRSIFESEARCRWSDLFGDAPG